MRSLKEIQGNFIAEKSDKKRDLILENARKLFSVFGIKKTTVDDIAKNARIAKGTIYNHFTGKEDIFEAVVKKESAVVLEKMKESVNGCSSARESIKVMVITKIRYFKEVILFYKVEQEKIDMVIPAIQLLREQFFKEEEKLVKNILEQGMLKQEIEKVDYIDTLSHIIIIALKELERPWVMEKDMEEVSRLADRLVNVLFDGIGKK